MERKSILEYIKNKKSTSDFTQKIHQIVERTKENQAFRGEYMAWGLAEQDAEKRGYKAGVTDGIMQGAEQKAIETAQNLLAMHLSLDNIAKATGLSLETIKNLQQGKILPRKWQLRSSSTPSSTSNVTSWLLDWGWFSGAITQKLHREKLLQKKWNFFPQKRQILQV